MIRGEHGASEPGEFADVGRLARRLIDRAVETARTDDPGRRGHEVYGITGIGFMRHMEIVGIGDLLLPSGDSAFGSAGAGGVMTTALPRGPDGQTRACVSHGVYLVHDGATRLAMVLQPVSRGPNPEVILQIAGEDQAQLDAVLRQIRHLTSERSVFRGQVISFGPRCSG